MANGPNILHELYCPSVYVHVYVLVLNTVYMYFDLIIIITRY